MSRPPVGIDRIGIWPGTLAVSIGELCRARGLDEDNFVRRLYCQERSLVGPFEDVVTLAVNAAERVLRTEEDRASVKLLLVATESAVDQEKPLSSWVHHHLRLPDDCRNLELKHACYGATGAMQLALSWLAAAAPPGARALVVNTDHALIGLHGPQEPVLGAGAAAVLLSRDPGFAVIEPGNSGVFAHEIADIFRPAPGVETGDAEDSLLSYLEGAEKTWEAFSALNPGLRFGEDFAAHLYHVPFGGLAERAHLRLCKRELGHDRPTARAHFAAKVEPSLRHNRRMGGVYGAATFVAMLGMAESLSTLREGDRVSVYAYGSGSCAETYALRVGPRAAEVAAEAGLGDLLDARRVLDVPAYERCEQALHGSLSAQHHEPDPSLVPGHYASHYQGQGRLVFRGVHDWRRRYERS